jgi:hypothetical protein
MIWREFTNLCWLKPASVNTGPKLLGAVVERLLQAMRETQPVTVRQLFGLANQHIQWEAHALRREA